jgi:general secretion pathway protein G
MVRRIRSGRAGRLAGFTLIELMIVMAIIATLISIAVPIYNRAITRSKETVLKNNLFTLRRCIDEYTVDKQKAPQSLQDLVSDGYLRQMPMDPIAGTADWKVIMEDPDNAMNPENPGIFDVRSTADRASLDGTQYADW